MSEYIIAELEAAQTASLGALQAETNASIRVAESILDEFAVFEDVSLATEAESVLNLDLAAAEVGITSESVGASSLLGPLGLLIGETVGVVAAEQSYLDKLDLEGTNVPFEDLNPGGIYDYKPPTQVSVTPGLNRGIKNYKPVEFVFPEPVAQPSLVAPEAPTLRQRIKKDLYVPEWQITNDNVPAILQLQEPVTKGKPPLVFPVDYRRDRGRRKRHGSRLRPV